MFDSEDDDGFQMFLTVAQGETLVCGSVYCSQVNFVCVCVCERVRVKKQ